MADIKSEFSQIFFTYSDVREANPDWTEKMVEDYMASKRDLATVADFTDETLQDIADNTQQISGNIADIGKIQAVNNRQKKQIDILIAQVIDLIALSQVDRQNIADLISDNGKLRALINRLQSDGRNYSQLLAGLE